jgi:hypothetical protein
MKLNESRRPMHLKMKKTFLAFAVLIASLQSSSSNAADIWYEDNNLGTNTEMPVDFVDKFRHPESFQQATHYIKVYLLRAPWLEKMDDDFFTNLLIPYLQKNNIKLALNSAGAIWYGAKPIAERRFKADLALLNRLKQLGVRVDYISMQSILSKPLRRSGKGSEILEFPMERRVAGAVAFTRAAREIYPDVLFGLIDALPGKGLEYKDAYRQLADALRTAGIKLAYVHIDLSLESVKSERRGLTWSSLLDTEAYVEEKIGAQFGIFTTSRRAGQTSSRAFHDAALDTLYCYSGAGGTPRNYVIASWFRYPERTIPDAAKGDDYPMMRTVLDFGHELDQLQNSGKMGAPIHRPDDWARRCKGESPN